VEAGRELVIKHGREALAKVAKMHFRTSQKVLEQVKS
jgi:ribonuclease HIII